MIRQHPRITASQQLFKIIYTWLIKIIFPLNYNDLIKCIQDYHKKYKTYPVICHTIIIFQEDWEVKEIALTMSEIEILRKKFPELFASKV